MQTSRILPVTFAAALAASGALAQQSDWDYSASFYLFMPETETGIDTSLGSADSTLSFSDALDNLDFAFMGAFEAHNGRWGGLIDVMHTNLSFGSDTSGPAFSGIDTDLELNIITVAGLYRVHEDARTTIDLSAGFRWSEVDTTIEFTPGAVAGRVFEASTDWFDPVIGARFNHQFSDRWSGTGLFDYGGTGDSESWQVLLTANYAINENWVFRGGYRYVSLENEDGGATINVDQYGPIFGFTYQF